MRIFPVAMANITSETSFITFRSSDDGDPCEVLSPDYLRAREAAERAAAKASSSEPARIAHRELAKLYAKQRRNAP